MSKYLIVYMRICLYLCLFIYLYICFSVFLRTSLLLFSLSGCVYFTSALFVYIFKYIYVYIFCLRLNIFCNYLFYRCLCIIFGFGFLSFSSALLQFSFV